MATASTSGEGGRSISDWRRESDDSIAVDISPTLATAAWRRSSSGMSSTCCLSRSASLVPLLSSWIAASILSEEERGGCEFFAELSRVDMGGLLTRWSSWAGRAWVWASGVWIYELV